MKHTKLKAECQALGLTVFRTENSADGHLARWEALADGVRVYWTASLVSDTLVGMPRVVKCGWDTHARTVNEVKYLVQL